MSVIYLIRHGLTEANEKHLYCGSTDLPLTAAGRQALRGLHYSCPAADYVTSGMRRTDETMELLFPGQPYRRDPDFREIDFGIFEMHSYEQLKDDPAYQAWISGDNETNVPPGGESGRQMTLRVTEAFARLQASGRNTVLVTHGGVIAAILAELFPNAGRNRYQWQPRPGGGYKIEGSSWQEL